MEIKVFKIDKKHIISVRINSVRENKSAIIPLSYLSNPNGNTFAQA